VGEITLIDMDEICVTNTNRQIHAEVETIGQPKVQVMADRIKAINPVCKVHAIDDFLTEDTLGEYLARDYDFVIDAIDSVISKAQMIYYCKRNKIPIVCTGGAGGQTDPTQVAIKDLSRTWNDPLAAKVRSLLRREYGFSKSPGRSFSVPCVFSSEQLVYPRQDGSVCQQKTGGSPNLRMDCESGFGAATVVTATFGFAAVSRVIKKIVEKAARA